MPMPTASITAATAPTLSPEASAPNATPIASPSGMLCIVTATHIMAHRCFFALSENRLSLLETMSVTIISNPPRRKPHVSIRYAKS